MQTPSLNSWPILWIAVALVIPRAEATASQTLDYTITRDGERIGNYHFEINETGETRQVRASMAIDVRLAGLPVYRASHERVEIWEADRLVSHSARSRYNARAYEVEWNAEDGNGTLVVNGERQRTPEAVLSFVPWMPRPSEAQWLITEKGYLRKFQSSVQRGISRQTPSGKRDDLTRVSISGDIEREAWYDEEGILEVLQYEHKGAQIVVHRTPVGAEE